MLKKTGIDQLVHERIWSESVYFDCVSSDGQKAIMIRLCRYPEYLTSWLWVYCFLPHGIYGYYNNYLPCSPEISLVEEPNLKYSTLGQEKVILQRFGERDLPKNAQVIVDIKAHKQGNGLFNKKTSNIKIKAKINPRYKPWRANRYRTEWISESKCVIQTDDKKYDYHGYGHWHEQHQKAPRWKTPFTYITLRGDSISLIGTATNDIDAGFVTKLSSRLEINKIKIDPPGLERKIKIHLNDGSSLKGETHTVYDYLVPVYDRWRPGTIVTAEIENKMLTGCINDWKI